MAIPWPWSVLQQQAITDTAAIRQDIAALLARTIANTAAIQQDIGNLNSALSSQANILASLVALVTEIRKDVSQLSGSTLGLDFSKVERRPQPVPTDKGP